MLLFNVLKVRKAFNRAAKSVFLFFFEKACIFFKKKTLLVKNGKILQVRKVSNRAAKSFFFLKIMQAFLKKNKKTSYTLLMNNGKVLQVRKVSNRAEYFSVIHQKRVRRLFIFFLKSLHHFLKKDAFSAVERRLLKKNTWKIFQDSVLLAVLLKTFRTCNIFQLLIKSV